MYLWVAVFFLLPPLIQNVVEHLTVTLHFKMYKTGISRLEGGKQLSEDLSESKKKKVGFQFYLNPF